MRRHRRPVHEATATSCSAPVVPLDYATMRMNQAALIGTSLALASILVAAHAQNLPPGQYDESRVPAYTLPDPLVAQNGTRITTADSWKAVRRPELLALFAREVYGATPSAPLSVTTTVTERGVPALGGVAARTQVNPHLQRKRTSCRAAPAPVRALSRDTAVAGVSRAQL